MKEKIKFGIIGCSSIAEKSFIPSIVKSDYAILVSLASRDINKAKLFANKFNCEYDNDYNSLFARDDIDAIYISTVPSTHEKFIKLAIDNNKHVLCEKPFTTSLDSVKRILNYKKEKKLAIFEGFMYQFHSQHNEIKNIVLNGKIGFPKFFYAQFGFPHLKNNNFRYNKELGGGALLDAGCYTIHSARKFFEKEPIEVFSTLFSYKHEVDIQGSILLNFGEGMHAHLSFGFDSSYRNTYSIWGSQGHLRTTRAFSIPANYSPKILIENNGNIEEKKLTPDNQFVNQINYFCNYIFSEDKQKEWKNDILMQFKVIDRVINPLAEL